MTEILDFVQDQTYEGIQFHLEEEQSDGTWADLDISGATEIVLRCYTLDRTELKFSGSKTGTAEVTFVTDGTDGKGVFAPDAGDMADAGRFLIEVETTLGGKALKKHRGIITIKSESPTS